ncbi:MAG: radical SAM family heme chaperone HemW [Pseudomonadota bacterium]
MHVEAPAGDHAFEPAKSDKDAGFGIYVHWPFCSTKCPYCDFNSHVRRKEVDQDAYLNALRTELGHMARRTAGRTVQSIFFGGGTPSLMKPETVAGVIGAIYELWDVHTDVEISLEANPTSVEADRFAGFSKAGVNRVSLGVQAFNDRDLTALGRTHSLDQALAAVRIAQDHFARSSFDLIYARPGQTVTMWEDELGRVFDFAADHLSLYQLTIEPGTNFEVLHRAGKLDIPDPETAALMFESTQRLTRDQGLEAYEISNHARPHAVCRHNLVYWRYGEYVGVGPGAHGRLVERKDNFPARVGTSTERHPERWLARVEAEGHGIIEEELLNAEEMGDEFLVMGLRLREGISRERYTRLSGGRRFDPRQVDLMVTQGFIETDGADGLRATRDGSFLLDAVVADLAA